MTVEELKTAVEEMETSDVMSAIEDSRDLMLMIVAKLGEIEKRVDGKTS